jgi:hypothetical protein
MSIIDVDPKKFCCTKDFGAQIAPPLRVNAMTLKLVIHPLSLRLKGIQTKSAIGEQADVRLKITVDVLPVENVIYGFNLRAKVCVKIKDREVGTHFQSARF